MIAHHFRCPDPGNDARSRKPAVGSQPGRPRDGQLARSKPALVGHFGSGTQPPGRNYAVIMWDAALCQRPASAVPARPPSVCRRHTRASKRRDSPVRLVSGRPSSGRAVGRVLLAITSAAMTAGVMAGASGQLTVARALLMAAAAPAPGDCGRGRRDPRGKPDSGDRRVVAALLGEREAAVLSRTPLMTAAVPARGTVKAGDRRDHQESVSRGPCRPPVPSPGHGPGPPG